VKPVALCALVLASAGCSSGYNAGVTHVGHAHLLGEWKQWGAARPLSDSAAPRRLAAIRSAVRRSRAQAVSVRLYRIRTGARAPAIVVASFTPRSWLLNRARRLLEDVQLEVGRSGSYYLGLVDVHGRFVWETGRSMRATGPAGGVYAPRDIDACQPVAHGQLVGAPLPPCSPD
jgi:sirohydrochlorin ferrochelatase